MPEKVLIGNNKMAKNNFKEIDAKTSKKDVPADFKIAGYEVRKTPTVSDIIVVEGLKGAKDKSELAERVFSRLQEIGVTKTFKGEITPESVFNKVKANLRAFKNYKYKNFSLVESDDGLKLENGNVLQ